MASININLLTPPMPSSKSPIAIPTPMLYILQPPYAERDAVQGRSDAET